jgi:tRNA A37 threonylcarbamoyladenosine dehydratase
MCSTLTIQDQYILINGNKLVCLSSFENRCRVESAAAAATPSNMSKNTTVLAEQLYSRQIFVLGKEATLELQRAHALIVGLDGVGVEVAKNLALAGIGSLSLFDNQITTNADLATNFFIAKDAPTKKQTRAEVCPP